MTWVAVGVGVVGAAGTYAASQSAAGAAGDAAQMGYDADMAALQYLKETEKLPQELREGALTQLGGLYGLEGGQGSQQQLIDQAKASPYYTSMQQTGEDAILRNAAATGGLRSGNVQANLAKYNQGLLADAYQQQLSGLQGLAQLPSNATAIAAQQSRAGQTGAQGMIAQGQIKADLYGNMTGLAQEGVRAYGAYNRSQGGSFSDPRLKTNIVKKGKVNGHNWYGFTWNKEAEKLGLYGDSEGFLADEVEVIEPLAVTVKDGYKMVDYQMLGVVNA
jgi:hypothetical protein